MNTDNTFLLESLKVVHSVLKSKVDPDRIQFGNAKTYAVILLDGNSWRPICRLYDQQNKYIGLFNTRKVETRQLIREPQDISKFSDDLVTVVKKYLSEGMN